MANINAPTTPEGPGAVARAGADLIVFGDLKS